MKMSTAFTLGIAAMVFPAGAAQPETIRVNVGGRAPVVVDTKAPKRLAVFVEGSNNSALQATILGARRGAQERGYRVDVFDASWNNIRQIDQMQNALLRGYSGWILAAVNGEQACDMATREAPDRNVLVVAVVLPICGRATKEGDELYSPGLLAYIGGNETPRAFMKILQKAATDTAGPKQVGILTGPALNPITLSFEKALAEIVARHPEFRVVSKLRTDYSPPDSQVKFQTMLQANPDLDILIGVYTTMSKGAMPVLMQTGKLGKVKVYEWGGSEWSVDAIRNGWIEATSGFYRNTSAYRAVLAIDDARQGRPVQRVYLNDGHTLLPGQAYGDVAVITRENVAAFRSETP